MMFLLSSASRCSAIAASCKVQSNGKAHIELKELKDYDAYGMWDDTISSNGWGQIHLTTNSSASSENQMYCAGYVDAYLTADRIREAYYLFREENEAVKAWPNGWEDWIQKNMDYIYKNIKEPVEDYWKAMRLIVKQFEGMVAALADKKTGKQADISARDFWIFQSAGDFDDLLNVIPKNKPKEVELTFKCTGMFVFAPNYSDIYLSQNTWSDYRDLHAYLKEYSFGVSEFKTKKLAFSSRTGHINSDDDFWTADTGLFVLETTMHCFNKSLYKLVVPETVLTWMRVYYAMLTSNSGEEWTRNFIRYNSGTYNNEYLILDGKKFTPGRKPTKDLLWMIEQLPENAEYRDITTEFINQSWWPSVNTPYFQNIWDLANYSAQKSDYFSYYDQPRYKLIKQHVGDVVDYQSFQKFMRHNNYLNESEANYGLPEQGIEARYDLRPESGTKYGNRSSFGGLDSKTSTITRVMNQMSFDAINSPTYDNLPVYHFSQFPDISHNGLPDEWKFSWIEFSALSKKCNTSEKKEESCLALNGCGFCLFSQECYPILDKDRPSYGYKCESGWVIPVITPAYALPLVASISSIIVVFVGAIYISAYLTAKKDKNNTTYDNIK